MAFVSLLMLKALPWWSSWNMQCNQTWFPAELSCWSSKSKRRGRRTKQRGMEEIMQGLSQEPTLIDTTHKTFLSQIGTRISYQLSHLTTPGFVHRSLCNWFALCNSARFYGMLSGDDLPQKNYFFCRWCLCLSYFNWREHLSTGSITPRTQSIILSIQMAIKQGSSVKNKHVVRTGLDENIKSSLLLVK